MKKLLLFLAAVTMAATFSLKAQNSLGDLDLSAYGLDENGRRLDGTVSGIQVGVTMSSLNVYSNGVTVSTPFKTGFYIGVSTQSPLSKTLPIYYETGTGLAVNNYDLAGGIGSTRLWRIELPLMFDYKFTAGNWRFTPKAGFLYYLPIAGRHTYADGTVNKFNLFKDDNMFDYDDLGARVGLDIDFGMLSIGASYTWGLLNMDRSGVTKTKSNAVIVTIGLSI